MSSQVGVYDGSNMSACCMTTTARSCRLRAVSNAARSSSMSASVRSCDRLPLLGGRLGVAQPGPGLEPVVAAGHVGGHEGDAGAAVGDVLGEAPVGLGGDRERVLPQRPAGVVEEHLAERAQPLQRVVRTVVGAVAVRPLVVAGGVDQRVLEGVEVAADQAEVVVAAHRRPVLDVADVHHRPDGGVGVDLLDPARERRDLVGAVRHVADDREGVPRLGPGAVGSARRRSVAPAAPPPARARVVRTVIVRAQRMALLESDVGQANAAGSA